jgi:hypothetical protein
LQVPGLGIDGLGAAMEAFGYTRKDDSVFEKKKLRATWCAAGLAGWVVGCV